MIRRVRHSPSDGISIGIGLLEESFCKIDKNFKNNQNDRRTKINY